MTTLLFVRRFLADYARNPVNPLVLVLVPVVFVVVAAGSMAEAAKLLGGTGPSVETAVAGWAAGFLAGIALYFQLRAPTRWLPTHFVTSWMVDLPSRHGGRLGDLGWALAWTIGALVTACVVVVVTTRVARGRRTWGSFDETSALLLGLGWLFVLGVLAARLFRRATT